MENYFILPKAIPIGNSLKRSLKIMKLSTLLLLTTFLSVFAEESFSQNNMLTLNMEDATIKKVLSEVEDKSGYSFLYSPKMIDVTKTVDIVVDNGDVTDVLDYLFSDSDVKYSINGHHVLLSNKDVKVKLTSEEPIQQNVVTGLVTDDNGEPLAGVSIMVKGTTQGTFSDINGRYSLQVNSLNDVLEFSFIGMASQEVGVGGRSVVDVALQSEAIGLDEVVVVGYGTQKKVTLTGSVATTNSDFIASRPLTNSTQAIQGLQGIYVNQTGGQPGADEATIRIRGVGTLNDNNPLVLVDGIEYSLSDVNPNDIESISVLKDAASASIYGNRAANGVILVTTKKGKKEKSRIEYNGYLGFQTATYLPDMVTNSVDYLLARNEASINEGQVAPYSEAAIAEYRNGSNLDIYPNTDWYDIMFKTAPMHEHNIRVSGGTDASTYSLSIGYMNQEGILLNTGAEKYTMNTNVMLDVTKRLKVGLSVNGTYWDKYQPFSSMTGGDESVMGAIARALPIHPNILTNGDYGDTWLVTPGHNVFRHPYARTVEGGTTIKTQRVLVNTSLEYMLPLDIKYSANFAINKYDNNQHTFIPEIFCYDAKNDDYALFGKEARSVSGENTNSLNTSFFHTLYWTKSLAEQHTVSIMLGHSLESFYTSNLEAYVEDFLDNELTEINAGTSNMNVGGTSSLSRLMSYFGRMNYSFRDRYLFDFSFRYDGSSRFAKQNRWGFFPSLSAGWRISEESFMENLTFVDNLKLRASWGQLGNQNIALYSYTSNININQGYSFNNTVVAGSAITTLADQDISWETTTMTNVGLDISLFKNRVEFVVDVFDKRTSDILARISVPGQVGNLTGPITNLYEMSNKGVELSGSYRNTRGSWTYKVGGNVSFVKNNVDWLDGDIQYSTNAYGNISVIMEGYPINSWYLYEALGLFQSEEEIANSAFQSTRTSPGDIKYKDQNGDGVINTEDMKVLGRSVPKLTYGFDLNLDYKGFDFSAIFQGVFGIDIYPTNNVAWALYNGAGITKDQLQDHWTEDNRDASYPRLLLQKRGSQINAQNSTYWLKNASYLRLKNLQLGYTIPSKIINKINISQFRVYVNAQNYLTFSKYKLTDPEKNISNQTIYEYPTTKIISLGCNVTF